MLDHNNTAYQRVAQAVLRQAITDRQSSDMPQLFAFRQPRQKLGKTTYPPTKRHQLKEWAQKEVERRQMKTETTTFLESHTLWHDVAQVQGNRLNTATRFGVYFPKGD